VIFFGIKRIIKNKKNDGFKVKFKFWNGEISIFSYKFNIVNLKSIQTEAFLLIIK